MEVLFSGIKKMIYLYLFLAVFQQILPDSQYQKYVRFFSGLIFAAVILSPVLQLFHGENLVEQIEFEELFQEMEQVQLDYSYMDDTQQQYYAQEIEAEVIQKVEALAQKQGWTVSEIEVDVAEDVSAIEAISVKVGQETSEKESEVEIVPVASIFDANTEEETESEASIKLQEAISLYFELEEGQVKVFEV